MENKTIQDDKRLEELRAERDAILGRKLEAVASKEETLGRELKELRKERKSMERELGIASSKPKQSAAQQLVLKHIKTVQTQAPETKGEGLKQAVMQSIERAGHSLTGLHKAYEAALNGEKRQN